MSRRGTRVTDFKKLEAEHAKKTKEIYDRAEARFSDELGAAIEEAKAKKAQK